MTTPYARGRTLEYRVRDVLVGHGWEVTRSFGSRGPADLTATKDDRTIVVQVKSSHRLDPAEWNALIWWARREHATPVFCWKEGFRGRLHWWHLVTPKNTPRKIPPVLIFHPED